MARTGYLDNKIWSAFGVAVRVCECTGFVIDLSPNIVEIIIQAVLVRCFLGHLHGTFTLKPDAQGLHRVGRNRLRHSNTDRLSVSPTISNDKSMADIMLLVVTPPGPLVLESGAHAAILFYRN